MGVGLRGEGEGGEVSAVWGAGDVDVVGVVGGMAWDGEARLEEGWGFWLDSLVGDGEGGSGFEACCDGGREDRPLKQTLTFGRWRLRHEHRFRCEVLVSIQAA